MLWTLTNESHNSKFWMNGARRPDPDLSGEGPAFGQDHRSDCTRNATDRDLDAVENKSGIRVSVDGKKMQSFNFEIAK